ncbi:hypothetical protein AB0I81_20220 [Nonomuraea sp. NPDC050404]|uniref:hypothetical protein n=1 Tax=Nonomuraea sp. NPDC050404 TaxID=3155783 RepID=UPI0033C29B5F
MLFHKIANVLGTLPAEVRPPRHEEGPRADLERREQGARLAAIAAFETTYSAKFDKAPRLLADTEDSGTTCCLPYSSRISRLSWLNHSSLNS